MQISYVPKPPRLDPPGGDNQAVVSRGAIARLALNAAKWNYVGIVLRIVIQLLAQIVLARLLGPAEFGYFALCFMVVGVGYVLAEMGLSSALIQTPSLNDSDIRRAWTLLLASGLIGSGLLVAFSGPLAILLGNADAAPYLSFAAIPLFIQTSASVSLALLRKSLDFKRIQLAQISGMIIGQIFVGFTLAAMLHTAWAMLLAWFVQLLISWVLMFAKVRHKLAPGWPASKNRLSWFGVRALTANIANWLIENLDNLIVARFFGARALGLYAVSYNLVRYPTNHLVTTLQAVLFPTSAAVQSDQYALRTAYLASLSLVATVTLPVFTSAAIVAEPLILTLYGAEWREAIAIMQPLALAMPLHAVTAVSGPLLWGVNRVGTESLLQWLVLFCFIVAVLALNLTSPVQLAWVVFAVYLVRAGLLAFSVARLLQLGMSDMAVCFRGPFVLTCIAGGGSAAAMLLAESHHPLGQIGLAIGIESLLSFALFWFFPQWVLAPSLAKVLSRFSSSLPLAFALRVESISAGGKRRASEPKI
jgi:O-antigen/teichoic acid export membrane protein